MGTYIQRTPTGRKRGHGRSAATSAQSTRNAGGPGTTGNVLQPGALKDGDASLRLSGCPHVLSKPLFDPVVPIGTVYHRPPKNSARAAREAFPRREHISRKFREKSAKISPVGTHLRDGDGLSWAGEENGDEDGARVRVEIVCLEGVGCSRAGHQHLGESIRPEPHVHGAVGSIGEGFRTRTKRPKDGDRWAIVRYAAPGTTPRTETARQMRKTGMDDNSKEYGTAIR